jgi:hypothetical protein
MNPGPTIAPADAVPHRPWPIWRKVTAYLLLAFLASVSIWFIDRGAMQLQYPAVSSKP